MGTKEPCLESGELVGKNGPANVSIFLVYVGYRREHTPAFYYSVSYSVGSAQPRGLSVTVILLLLSEVELLNTWKCPTRRFCAKRVALCERSVSTDFDIVPGIRQLTC